MACPKGLGFCSLAPQSMRLFKVRYNDENHFEAVDILADDSRGCCAGVSADSCGIRCVEALARIAGERSFGSEVVRGRFLVRDRIDFCGFDYGGRRYHCCAAVKAGQSKRSCNAESIHNPKRPRHMARNTFSRNWRQCVFIALLLRPDLGFEAG